MPMTPEERKEWARIRSNAQAMLDEKLNGPPKDESEMRPAERPSNTPKFEQMQEGDT